MIAKRQQKSPRNAAPHRLFKVLTSEDLPCETFERDAELGTKDPTIVAKLGARWLPNDTEQRSHNKGVSGARPRARRRHSRGARAQVGARTAHHPALHPAGVSQQWDMGVVQQTTVVHQRVGNRPPPYCSLRFGPCSVLSHTRWYKCIAGAAESPCRRGTP